MSTHFAVKAWSRAGEATAAGRMLVREHRLELSVNGAPYAGIVCSSGRLRELAAGRLLGDGLLHCPADLKEMVFSADETACDVKTVKEEAVPGTAEAAPGAAAAAVRPAVWEKEWIFGAAERLAEGTPLYRATSAVHLAYLYRGSELLFTAEDISRQCAMEKALGYGFLQGAELRECWMFLSCRISAGLVQKAAAAALPLLASKSVPTADAVLRAEMSGLTLLCRAWPDQFEQFCGAPPRT